MSKEPQSWSKVLRNSFTWIGILSTSVGLVAASIALLDKFTSWQEEKASSAPLVSSSHKILIGADGSMVEPLLVADQIIVDGIRFQVPDHSIWIANELSLINGATLEVSEFAVVARRVSGGKIDGSGEDAERPGNPGLSGSPKLLIAAGAIVNVEVVAQGGNGAAGSPGSRGTSGRDGKCGPGVFGEFRASKPGKRGAPGKPGGAAGAGGHVVIMAPQQPQPRPIVSAGIPGEGGRGGEGGFGGRGCAGLGGNQPNRPPGPRGDDGPQGQSAEDGSYEFIEIDYPKLRETVAGHEMSPARALGALISQQK